MEIKRFGEKAYRFFTNPVENDAWITILCGAVRSSKTWAMIPKLLTLCDLSNPAIPKGLRVITGTSKEAVYDNVLRDLFDVIGEDSFRYNRQSGDLRLFDSKWKVIGARDEGSEKYLRGKTIAVAYGDEITTMPESFFLQLLNRLSPTGARLYGTTNPDSPFHYLYKDFMNNKEINEQGEGLVHTINFYLDDNPNISEEYKHKIRLAHSGVFYQRFVLGMWVLAEGLVYRDCFDEQENTFTDETAPPGLWEGYEARYVGLDYGTVNPQVYLDILDYKGTLYVCREYYFDSKERKCEKTDGEYGDDFDHWMEGQDVLQDGVAPYPLGPAKKYDAEVIADPSAESMALELRNRGFLVMNADNDVAPGIRNVSTMLKRRKMKINKDRCPNTLRERSTYCWDPAAAKRNEEKPLKQSDHCMDPLRYVTRTKIPKWRLLED